MRRPKNIVPAGITIPTIIAASAANFFEKSGRLLNFSANCVKKFKIGIATFKNISPIGAIANLNFSIAAVNFTPVASSIAPSSLLDDAASS